jgi:DNA replication protein DnaC
MDWPADWKGGAVSEAETLRHVIARVSAKVVEREPTPEELAAAERERVARAAAGAREVGIPRRFWAASFEAGEPTAALEQAGKFAARDVQEGRCLILSGPTGTGKSYAACATLNALRGHQRRFVHFPALCGALLDAGRRREILEIAKQVPVLVLDDLEPVLRPDLLVTFLDEIVVHREGEMLATLVTTNATPAQLREHLSDRITDRLREWGEVFAVAGPSLRRRAAEEAP